MSKITLVTGLWDLKRETLNEGWSRSYENHYLKKFDEHISIEKPKVLCKNLIFGTLMIDFGGTMNTRNHITKEKFELTFYEA